MSTKRANSRKARHDQKQLYIIGGVLVALVLFLLIFGLNLARGISLLIFGVAEDVVQTEDEQFFGTLFVNRPAVATNSAQIIVSGSVSNFDEVGFYINGEEISKTSVSEGSFEEEIGPLEIGENNFFVKGFANNGNDEQKSETYTISYINTKPELEITEPQNDATTSDRQITVRGTTDPNNDVEVNGSPTVVNAGGSFQSRVRIRDGENKIEVVARDIAGNETKNEITVRYEDD